MTPDKVFVCIALFNLLRLPMHLLPMGITELLRLLVSIKRINKFLTSKDLVPNTIVKPDKSMANSVQLCSASFGWDGNPVLDNLTLSIPKGSLVMVLGRVGAGKSTLLSAILGEAERLQGEVLVQSESTAYVSQQPWIQNMTAKNNILFGSNDDANWYQDVVKACALKDDFEILQDADETVIGENGINLSGGQKQRVSIARAVYKKADLYLLDDPLSALDAHTSNHVFDEVMSNQGLLKDTTRILVTHRSDLVNKADFLLVLKDGKVDKFGPPNKVMEADFKVEEVTKADNQEVAKKPAKKKEGSKALTKAKLAEKRIKDEEVLTGKVKLMAYNKYLSSVGYINAALVLLAFVANQAVSTGSTIWIAAWSDHSNQVLEASNNSTANSFDNSFYVGVLGAFGLAQGILSFVRNWFFFWACAKASVVLHNGLLNTIIKATMRFFDTTPTGTIANRFSGDMHVIDLTLPQSISSLLFTFIEVFSVMIVISISFPIFMVVILPLAVLYYCLLKLYVPTSRQLKRFEASSKSPINLHFSETVQGAATIRAFQEESRFFSESLALIQQNLQFQYYSIVCRRWLGLRSELIGNGVVLLAALLAVSQSDAVTAGWVGLTISYALSVTETFNWVLINGSNVEEQAVAVERVRETEKYTPQEGAWTRPDTDPKGAKWLTQGSVEFDRLSLAYDQDLPKVLHNLSLKIEPGQKIGVCGRTGAGKSSISVALFNLVTSWEGSIRLDQRETKSLGLHTLRSQMTVISQDPTLFHDTVRKNLDPLDEKTDADIWSALEQSQLKEVIQGLDQGLESMVAEGGSNFSLGQRQLLCLARALLRNSQIVMLDEATASMDKVTDEQVQETLFKELQGKTLITIAHRLETIINYDKILVLDQGAIKEFDSPQELLDNPNSAFYGMKRREERKDA